MTPELAIIILSALWLAATGASTWVGYQYGHKAGYEEAREGVRTVNDIVRDSWMGVKRQREETQDGQASQPRR